VTLAKLKRPFILILVMDGNKFKVLLVNSLHEQSTISLAVFWHIKIIFILQLYQ